jgi:hypothetical protein
MNDGKKKEKSEADAQLEREIRKGRKFTLTEAIGRMAGPGAMKGVSPITRKEQACAEIENWLTGHLPPANGELQVAMLRRIRASELLLHDYERPLLLLAACCKRVLDSDYLLKELVRDADVEWGRVQGTKPYFEEEGVPPHPDDPYTFASVRKTLEGLIEQLSAGQDRSAGT